MTLRARLALGLVAIGLVLLLPLGLTLGALHRLNESATALRDDEFRASLVLGRLREVAQEARAAHDAMLLAYSDTTRDRVEQQLGRLQSVSDSLAGFDLAASAERIRAAVSEVALSVPREIAFMQRGRRAGADSIAEAVTDSAFRRIEGGVAATETSLRIATSERVSSISDSTATTYRIAVASLVAAILAATALALWLLASISRPVRALERGMEAVADGELGHRLAIAPDRRDEFGRLAHGYADMVRRLRELNKLKAEFISVASHELKTPVNVMVGYLQLVQEGIYGDLTAKQRDVLRTVETQGHTLARLVKHLLDISRFEAGGSRVEPRAVALGGFLDDLDRAFQVLAVQREVRFLVSKVEALPPEVVWDVDRMNEVVGNLLTNAFKFTPHGGTVELRAAPHDDDAVMLAVSDTGAGIPGEQLPQIFQKFFQADNQRSASQKGTGLGLAIAKEIVEAHRGQITCDSTPGVGTTFTLVLPRVVRRRSMATPSVPMERV